MQFDGWLDLFVANGAVRIVDAMRGRPYPFQEINQLFHNDGAGKRLREVTDDAGAAFQRLDVGRGAAVGDLDNDGGIDIVVTNNNGPRLLRNVAQGRGHWLEVRAIDPRGNRFGIGATVTDYRSVETALTRRVHTDASYLSAGDHRVHFGLGPNPAIEKVTITWSDGRTESWDGVKADSIVTLERRPWQAFDARFPASV